ncbi:hypothetical protein ACTXT7_012104 [Hymenolepis weldensis]
MDMKQHEEQKRNFAITKAKLENMKPDPSISIDDFISKMLVSSSNKAKNTQRLPFNSTKAISEFKSPYFASNAETSNNFTDVWDNFQSSSIINGLGGVKNSVNINSTVNSDDFDEFTSFSPSFLSTNLNSNSENNLDLSQPCIPNNISLLAGQQLPKSTNSVVESVDEFSGFVAPQKPTSIANYHLNHYNVVNFASDDVFGSLSPTKTSKSPESFESLSSGNINDKELVVEPTSLIAQVQVQPATTTETTVDEDGFEEYVEQLVFG